jgi:hypothetical protein
MNQELEKLYPEELIGGGPIRTAFEAIQTRLKIIFPERLYRHHIIPPHASKADWSKIIGGCPAIALGWAGWSPDRDCGSAFRGDMAFALFGIVQSRDPAGLYFGDDRLRGAGTMGITALAAAALHGMNVPDMGACMIRKASVPSAAADWLKDGIAIVALEVAIENVSFDLEPLRDTLPDFLRLAEAMQINGDASRSATEHQIGEGS